MCPAHKSCVSVQCHGLCCSRLTRSLCLKVGVAASPCRVLARNLSPWVQPLHHLFRVLACITTLVCRGNPPAILPIAKVGGLPMASSCISTFVYSLRAMLSLPTLPGSGFAQLSRCEIAVATEPGENKSFLANFKVVRESLRGHSSVTIHNAIQHNTTQSVANTRRWS